LLRSDTIPACDRQTQRHGTVASTALAWLAIQHYKRAIKKLHSLTRVTLHVEVPQLIIISGI